MISLSPLSILPAGPIEQIDAAAEADFDMVGMRLNPVLSTDTRIMEDKALQRRIVERLSGSDLTVLDIEVFRVTPTLDVEALVPTMEFGAALGARYLLCTFPLLTEGSFGDEDRNIESLVALAEHARPFGLRPMLEFMKFRLVGSLTDALRVVRKAAHDNVGICVDALHLERSGGSAAEVAAIDPSLVCCCQICDAPLASPEDAELPHEARYQRLSPGRGGLPLVDLLNALPDGVPLSVEVPDARRVADPPAVKARRFAEDTRELLRRGRSRRSCAWN